MHPAKTEQELRLGALLGLNQPSPQRKAKKFDDVKDPPQRQTVKA